MDKPEIDGEKGGWILGGIVALAGIVRTYIVRTKTAGGSLGDNMALVYKQQDALVERYRAEAGEERKRAADCEREKATLFEQLSALRSEVILMRAEIADLKEEIAALKGES